MIIGKNTEIRGPLPKQFNYCRYQNLLSHFFLPLTRYLRAKYALQFISKDEGPLLDLGCGDGYFLRLLRLQESYGFDELLGDRWDDLLQFSDCYFSYITMLAVVEHLENIEVINRHLWRILKPHGRLIITTPTKSAEMLIRLYAPDIKNEHKQYFSLNSMNTLLSGKYQLIDYRKFLFRLNQVFCYERMS